MLIPEFGKYDSHTGKIILAKRPSLDKLQEKLKDIQEMSDEKIKIKLSQIGQRPVRGLKRPRDTQKTKISEFFPKRNFPNNATISFKPYFMKMDIFKII